MTTADTAIVKARQEFLLAFNETQLSSELLRQFLAKAEKATANLIEPYAADEMLGEIDTAPSSWDIGYYSRQKRYAGQNFSRERLEHLISVREHFRQEGYKGFVPQAAGSEASGTDKVSQGNGLGGSASAYQPSSNLKRFVGEGDLLTIRTALQIEFNNNRMNGQSLRDAGDWVKGEVPDLFEPYTEKAFARAIDPDSSHWQTSYYDNQTVYLQTNFSEERFLHLVEVREHLRQRGVEGFAAIATAIPPGSQPAPRPRAASSAADHTPSTPNPEPRAARPELNPIFKIALLVGGALAAVVVYLSLVK